MEDILTLKIEFEMLMHEFRFFIQQMNLVKKEAQNGKNH